jgi:translation initiation factor IF-1
MILLEVKLAINGNCKKNYENIYEGDEVIVLTWFLIPSIGHYHFLHSSIN